MTRTSLCLPPGDGLRTMVPLAWIVLALVALPTLGADAGAVFTLGGVVGDSFALCVDTGFSFPTLAPTTPLERIFPSFWRHWSVSVAGVPGGKDCPPGCGYLISSFISLSKRFILSEDDVFGSSQLTGKNSSVLDTRGLLVLGMKHV